MLGALVGALAGMSLRHGGLEVRAQERTLRVCADPNNMPFSNAREEGFENRLAALVAKELGAGLAYTWWPQRRGFVRNTLKAGRCDVIMGVPAGYELVQTTSPYYRSSYVFVTRRDRKLDVHSFDDPRLKRALIGVHVIGDDYAALPPMQVLARRGIVDNLRGFSIYGSYSEPDPPRALIDAVARGEIDVAVAWGPLGGYFARRSKPALRVRVVTEQEHSLSPPMSFEIAMGVRHGDKTLRDELERIIVRKRAQIRGLLTSYRVPLLPSPHGAHRTPESN